MRFKIVIFFLFIQVCISGCTCNQGLEPVHRFENYTFSSHNPILARVSLPPEIVLRHLQNLDNRPDYTGYMPSHDELQNFEKAIRILPSLNRSMLDKRLLGIYFIPNFMGSGLTEWVVDRTGGVYGFMVFNASVLRLDLSELLTVKERTCYINDDAAYTVQINSGKNYSGLLYILLHESTHLVDYVMNITPYVDNSMNDYLKQHVSRTPFTSLIWKAYNKPVKNTSFTGRVFFYGIKKPKLRLSESVSIYRDLSKSPFVSLYGSQTWAEDLAEMVSFYHITEILKQPYVIQVRKGPRILLSVRPMDSPDVWRRLPAMEFFYTHEAP